jgi:hypothetical protein
MGWGSYLRLRVNIDITKPLERGRALILAGKSSWVAFKYEKLSQFCFRCGRLVHGNRGCPVPPVTRFRATEEPKPWGSWLRAADLRRRGFRGGDGFREASNQNRYREEEPADGAQVNGKEPQTGNPDSYGNPRRLSTPRTPAGSVGSGTYQIGKEAENGLRKEISASMAREGAASKAVDQGMSTNQIDMGQTIGLEEEVNMGFFNEEVILGVNEVGLVQGDFDTTSMDIIPAGAATQEGAEMAVVHSPKPSLKTWKRLARGVNETRPTMSRCMTKKGKREAEEHKENGNGKRRN